MVLKNALFQHHQNTASNKQGPGLSNLTGCSHGAKLYAGAARCAELIINGNHIIDHADGNDRTDINTPSTSCTLGSVDFDHILLHFI